eukprot:756365-Hanusia_phi.AAC.2
MSSGLCGCFFGSRMLLAGCTGGGCRVSVRDLERVQLSSIAAPDELLFEHEHASGGPAGMRALVQEILNEIRLANWKRKPKAIHMLSSDAHTNFRVSAPFRPKSDGRGQVMRARPWLTPDSCSSPAGDLVCKEWAGPSRDRAGQGGRVYPPVRRLGARAGVRRLHAAVATRLYSSCGRR